MESAQALLEHLTSVDESDVVEAKKASAIGHSIMETVCALANEPGLGGGHLLLGVERDKSSLFYDTYPTYAITGISDPDKIQSDLVTRCSELFNVPIRPRVKPETLQNKTVIVVFVPESAPSDKPVYFKKDGLPRGAFRRIGGTDHRCTDEDLPILFHGRQIRTFDCEILDDATMFDIDPQAVSLYRNLRTTEKMDATEITLPDDELLSALGVAAQSKGELRPTVAGLLLFGKQGALKRFFPTSRVDYIRVPGKEWVPDPDARYRAIPIHKSLIETVFSARDAVLDDLPKGFDTAGKDMQRSDHPLIPARVIREAIVNAVVHRCYRSRGPVQIIRYSNRVEIINPGYSLKSVERLREPGSEPRNPMIADAIRGIGLAEQMGLGIKLMIEKMAQQGLEPPSIESDRAGNRFIIRLLFHHFLSDDDLKWLSRFSKLQLCNDDLRTLIYVREVGAIDNATYRSFSHTDTLAASHRLRSLCDASLLLKKASGSNTYYVPTGALINPVEPQNNPTGSQNNPTGSSENPTDKTFLGPPESGIYTSNEDWEKFDGELEELPPRLQKLVDSLPGRAGTKKMATVILSLCEWRDLKATEIAAYCRRNAQYLREAHIAKLLDEKLLNLTDQPASPNLRYCISTQGKEWLNRKRPSAGDPEV